MYARLGDWKFSFLHNILLQFAGRIGADVTLIFVRSLRTELTNIWHFIIICTSNRLSAAVAATTGTRRSGRTELTNIWHLIIICRANRLSAAVAATGTRRSALTNILYLIILCRANRLSAAVAATTGTRRSGRTELTNTYSNWKPFAPFVQRRRPYNSNQIWLNCTLDCQYIDNFVNKL